MHARTIQFTLLIGTLVLPICRLEGSDRRSDADFREALAKLAAVKADGTGNREAAAAWKRVAGASPEQLTELLAAMDDAGPLGRNWLRVAFEGAVDRLSRQGADMPLEAIQAFVLDRQHSPAARELAFEWLTQVEPKIKGRLVSRFLDDPSVALRREGVADLIGRAKQELKSGSKEAAERLFERSLQAARDKDQVQQVAKALRRMGHEVDLPRHFGFLTRWRLIGPFDNSERAGFAAVYPPEKERNAKAEYEGKDGKKIRWIDYRTKDDFGMVDLNKPFGKLKDAVGYAWTTFDSDRPQDVELRLGCKNAWKLWVNGRLVFARDEYHRGMRMDQYRFPVRLKAGPNEILVKLCQNEQQETWTVEWQFQLRVCDATGTAILSAGDHAQ